jgi:integrase
VSEALALQLADVDLTGAVLRIRQTKFRKSRIVPMHPTTVRAMRHFAKCRERENGPKSSCFFVGWHGGPLHGVAVRCTFRRICNQLGWKSNGELPRPRIHDIRHTFACRRLLLWYRDGTDVHQAMLSLSTYLGHGKVTDTYWYLTATPELLSIAAGRFQRFSWVGGRKT